MRFGGNGCGCTGFAVTFIQGMQTVERMSMTRRRILDAARDYAELCLGVCAAGDLRHEMERRPAT